MQVTTKNDLQPGDILIQGGGGFISKAIKFFTKSKYSHVMIVWDYGFVVDATWPEGVRIRELSKVKKAADVFRLYRNLTNFELYRLNQAIGFYIGHNYDIPQFFGYLLFGFKGPNKWNSPSNMICSELIDRVYHEALKIDLLENIDKGDATPKQLSESPFLRKVGEIS